MRWKHWEPCWTWTVFAPALEVPKGQRMQKQLRPQRTKRAHTAAGGHGWGKHQTQLGQHQWDELPFSAWMSSKWAYHDPNLLKGSTEIFTCGILWKNCPHVKWARAPVSSVVMDPGLLVTHMPNAWKPWNAANIQQMWRITSKFTKAISAKEVQKRNLEEDLGIYIYIYYSPSL